MISAILLAAGESRRMGDFKQLLPFGSTTIIDCAITALVDAGVDELIVVVGHRAQDLRAHLARQAVKIVYNEAYRAGMTGSVQKGLGALDPAATAAIIALVDQPRVEAEIIVKLIESYRQTGALIVKPQYQGRSGHPIIIDMKLKAEIMALTPDQGLNQVTRAHAAETVYVPVASSSVVEDIDTPEDYRHNLKS